MFDFFWTQKSRDRRKVAAALVGYPVFSPPYPGTTRKRAEHYANYEYFMREKPKRLEYLALFFAKFSINLEITPACVQKLDDWMYRFGHNLARPKSLRIFSDYGEAWSARYLSFNLINDIGLFLGDYVVHFNNRSFWGFYEGDGQKIRRDTMEYLKPCILFGPPIDHKDVWQPNYWVFSYCCEMMEVESGAPRLSELTQANAVSKKIEYLCKLT